MTASFTDETTQFLLTAKALAVIDWQANRACPALRILMAALRSAFSAYPQLSGLMASTSPPCLLVFQLAAELTPALIENRLIEAGLGFDTSPWCLNVA